VDFNFDLMSLINTELLFNMQDKKVNSDRLVERRYNLRSYSLKGKYSGNALINNNQSNLEGSLLFNLENINYINRYLSAAVVRGDFRTEVKDFMYNLNLKGEIGIELGIKSESSSIPGLN